MEKGKKLEYKLVKKYILDNDIPLPSNNGDFLIIWLSDLKAAGYIDEISDPKSNTPCRLEDSYVGST